MTLTRYLFGDFSATFHTSLPLSDAAGRLAAISDQSFSPQAKPQLHGYATVHEVILWEGSDVLINPFRPHFRGVFSQEHELTILKGVFRAHWITKVWCGGMAAGSLFALYLGLTGQLSQDPLRVAGVLAVAMTAFVLLHYSIRPGSSLTRSLSAKIEVAIAGEGANNSFKPNPLRGSA